MTVEPQKYDNAHAFRKALEDRLKNLAREQAVSLDRLRRRITFDRFLARLFDEHNKKPIWLLKGGYALEFRFQNIARTTKDVDFSIPYMKNADSNIVRALLQEEVKRDLSDWFIFYIGTPMKEFDQAVDGGWRYPVEARVANREFTKFHIDVGIGDVIISEAEWKIGEDSLRFAGIKPAYVAILPIEQHFAEKIHAYSYPRDQRPFSRMRDLVDLVLLIEQGLPGDDVLLSAVKATFECRRTHDIPVVLEAPPDALVDTYVKLADDCGIAKKTMAEGFSFLQKHWERIRK